MSENMQDVIDGESLKQDCENLRKFNDCDKLIKLMNDEFNKLLNDVDHSFEEAYTVYMYVMSVQKKIKERC